LDELGFSAGTADGIFGKNTERAVKDFQQSVGLSVDGIVGPNTEAALAAAGGITAPPGSGSGTDPWVGVPRDDRLAYAMAYLVDRGYPENGAAGIVGNLDAESGVLPSRVEGSRPATPMRARDFSGTTVDFTPEQVMNRDRGARTGPQRPGVGLAQWTSGDRRAGLFTHSFGGRVLGAQVLFDMDAQLDYLVGELRGRYGRVNDVVSAPGVSVTDAAAEVVYRFEVPGAVLEGGSLRPRTDPAVQEVFRARTERAEAALAAHRRASSRP
jgi:peptidoglycan hydrolase-like protein with peptidoglycan-binding domain